MNGSDEVVCLAETPRIPRAAVYQAPVQSGATVGGGVNAYYLQADVDFDNHALESLGYLDPIGSDGAWNFGPRITSH